ncbi:MAG: tRNA (adenine-N1)-methyltransferase [Acidimicrobiia bacterium]
MTGKPFSTGEQILLVDRKERRYLVRLVEGGAFHYHRGVVPHDRLVGIEEGATVESSAGARLLALRPRLTDYILKMRRGAQVVYPKDIGPILVYGDIAPGSVVLEAGTGSGALAMALVRAVGPGGRVVSVERRPDHAQHAREAITRWFGELPANLELLVGEVEDHWAETAPDRVVLDLPEPWHTVEPAARHLPGGGVFCAYLPTVPQVQQLVEALRGCGAFAEITCFESLIRFWNVDGRSVRPDHRMVGHTGFIVVARKVSA